MGNNGRRVWGLNPHQQSSTGLQVRPLYYHVNLGMMLTRDYASCHTARSSLVMIVTNNVQKLRWPAQSLDLNPIDHLLDILKCKVHAQPLQLNLRELTRVIHQMCAAIPQHFINEYKVSCCSCDTRWTY